MKTTTASPSKESSAPELPKTPNAEVPKAPEAWEEFLEDEGDCCGGCNHKPR